MEMGKKNKKKKKKESWAKGPCCQSRIWAEGPTTRPDNLLLLDQRPI